MKLARFFLCGLGLAALLAIFDISQGAPIEVKRADFTSLSRAAFSQTDVAGLTEAGRTQLVAKYGQLPLSFEANRGQTHSQVKFLSRGPGYTLFLTDDESVVALEKSKVESQSSKVTRGQTLIPKSEARTAAVLRMKLVGANKAAAISGLNELPGKANYFIGNDATKWRTNVPTYGKVQYKNIYSGIDLIYYGNQRQLEYDFVVAPGADPRAILLEVQGAKKLKIDGAGDLLMNTGEGEIYLHKPVVYQRTRNDGKRAAGVPPGKHFLNGRYVLKGRAALRSDTGIFQVAFEVAGYDATKPLVIDPVLSYSTYLGGSGTDAGVGIAVDSSGNAYVTGTTSSINFPGVSPSSIQPALNGSSDAFVAKLNAAGTALVYSTYLGGSGVDSGVGIAVDFLRQCLRDRHYQFR